MNNPDGDRAASLEEARRLFLLASKLDVSSAEPYYRLGALSKRLEEHDAAISYFKRALVRDPDHVEAARELRLLRSRGHGGKKGLLGGLFRRNN